jgi:hypothetical protein
MSIDDFTAVVFYLQTAPMRYSLGTVNGKHSEWQYIASPIDAVIFYRIAGDRRAVEAISLALETLNGRGRYPIQNFVRQLSQTVKG